MENIYETPNEPTPDEVAASMEEPTDVTAPRETVQPASDQKAPPTAEATVEVDGIKYPVSQVRNALTQAKKHPHHMGLPDTEAPAGRMLLCDFHLKHSKVGSSTPLYSVTPAEMVLLVADHHREAGGNPVTEFSLSKKTKRVAVHHRSTGADGKVVETLVRYDDKPTDEAATVARSATEERDRLIRKYGEKRVKTLYPGAIPSLPSSFREALQLGLGTELETNSMTGDRKAITEHDLTS